jgi:hypothetical protein
MEARKMKKVNAILLFVAFLAAGSVADLVPTDGKVNFADFSTFAAQWLWCNDPADSGCVHNW